MKKSPASQDGRRLGLSEDVFFCVSEGQAIFLDLAQDEYSAVPMSGLDWLDGRHLSDEALCALFEPHWQELIETGLLTDVERRSPGFQAYRDITRPVRHIFGDDDQRAFGLNAQICMPARIGPAEVISFFWASWRAARLLRTRRIRDIVRRVRSRKSNLVVSPDMDHALRQRVAVYRKLRPWFPASYLCLYDALALIEFLAQKKLFPIWVFGVQAQPFGAHCWLQNGEELLNESNEYAGQFTPIMTV